MLELIAQVLVLSGALILLAALYLVRKLMAQLPQGTIRRNWYWMTLMVVLFFLSYLGYMYTFAGNHITPIDIMVPGVFFLGACFVWLTTNLSLRTLMVVTRISRLEHDALTDPLTGAYNRRHLDQLLPKEISAALRHNHPLSVLLVDIDHFKSINDSHGHQAGDQALVSLSEIARKVLRTTDVFIRYGGEEFLVIAPHTPAEGAIQLAERLRQRIAENPLILPGNQSNIETKITVSVGVASLADEVSDANSLVNLADENLYRAKQEGRNRVVSSP